MSRITLAGARYWHGNYSCHALARRKGLGILPAEKELIYGQSTQMRSLR